jgi:peroxiredoxin family protein/rhodanese-related sulfurtransferase/TusA-related sulfurtransferase
MLNGNLKVKYWRDINSKSSKNWYLIDTRTSNEFELGSIPGAVNIPLDDIRERVNEIPKDKEIVVFCAVGLRGYVAARSLKLLGYDNVFNLSGGYKTWEYAAKKQSNEDIYDNLIVKKDDQIYQHATNALHQDITAIKVDACGLQCPGPILKLKKVFETAQSGQVFEITATDPAFAKDVDSWCKITGNKLQSVKYEHGKVIALAQKAKPIQKTGNVSVSDEKTFVVFSDDLDRALASFVIANGAASTGKKVTMFFTFWGLNVIKKTNKPAVKKDFMGKMFSMMMPSDSKKLKLSKMNMLGMGTWMMRKRMEKLGVDSLEKMIQTAIDNGVEMIACQMSMDVMGVKKEELFDNVQIGGVAAFLESAEESNMSLFV